MSVLYQLKTRTFKRTGITVKKFKNPMTWEELKKFMGDNLVFKQYIVYDREGTEKFVVDEVQGE